MLYALVVAICNRTWGVGMSASRNQIDDSTLR